MVVLKLTIALHFPVKWKANGSNYLHRNLRWGLQPMPIYRLNYRLSRFDFPQLLEYLNCILKRILCHLQLDPYHPLLCNCLTFSLDTTKICALSFPSQVHSIYITKQLSHSTSDKWRWDIYVFFLVTRVPSIPGVFREKQTDLSTLTNVGFDVPNRKSLWYISWNM